MMTEKIKTEVLIIRLQSFISDCFQHNAIRLANLAGKQVEKAKKTIAYQYDDLSREYNEFGRYKTALKLTIERNKLVSKGDVEAAKKMQSSIDRWTETDISKAAKTNTSKWEEGWRAKLKLTVGIFLLIALPAVAGVLIYCYVEFFIVIICFVPGLIAFFGGALKNGGKV